MDLPKGERGATGAWLEENVSAILSDEFFNWPEVSHIKAYKAGKIDAGYAERPIATNNSWFSTNPFSQALKRGNTVVASQDNTPSGTSRMMYSNDRGATWSYSDSQLDTITGLFFVNNTYVALRSSDIQLSYSTDLLTWNSTLSNVYGGAKSIIYAINGFCIVNPTFINIGRVAITDNGSLANPPSGMTEINDLYNDGTRYIICGQASSNTILATISGALVSGGNSWVSAISGTGNLKSIAHSTTLPLYLCAGGSDLYSSTNGTTWSVVSGHGMTGVEKVFWHNGGFTAFGSSGVYRSTNGTSWTLVSTIVLKTGSVDQLTGVLSGINDNDDFYEYDGRSSTEAWQYAPLKYWDGSEWKTRYLKRWNGSEWVIEKG